MLAKTKKRRQAIPVLAGPAVRQASGLERFVGRANISCTLAKTKKKEPGRPPWSVQAIPVSAGPAVRQVGWQGQHFVYARKDQKRSQGGCRGACKQDRSRQTNKQENKQSIEILEPADPRSFVALLPGRRKARPPTLRQPCDLSLSCFPSSLRLQDLGGGAVHSHGPAERRPCRAAAVFRAVLVDLVFGVVVGNDGRRPPELLLSQAQVAGPLINQPTNQAARRAQGGVCSSERVRVERVCLPCGRHVCSSERARVSGCAYHVAGMCAVLSGCA